MPWPLVDLLHDVRLALADAAAEVVGPVSLVASADAEAPERVVFTVRAHDGRDRVAEALGAITGDVEFDVPDTGDWSPPHHRVTVVLPGTGPQ